MSYVASQAFGLFGDSYDAGDPVDASDWPPRLLARALDRGWIEYVGGGGGGGAGLVLSYGIFYAEYSDARLHDGTGMETLFQGGTTMTGDLSLNVDGTVHLPSGLWLANAIVSSYEARPASGATMGAGIYDGGGEGTMSWPTNQALQPVVGNIGPVQSATPMSIIKSTGNAKMQPFIGADHSGTTATVYFRATVVKIADLA